MGNATGAAPAGRKFSSASESFPHHRSKSSSANSSACKTARPTAGTSVSVPRNHGSIDDDDIDFRQAFASRKDGVVQPFPPEIGDVLHESHDQRMWVVLARRKLWLKQRRDEK